MLNKQILLTDYYCDLCKDKMTKGSEAFVDQARNLITCSKTCYKKAVQMEKDLYVAWYPTQGKAA